MVHGAAGTLKTVSQYFAFKEEEEENERANATCFEAHGQLMVELGLKVSPSPSCPDHV